MSVTERARALAPTIAVMALNLIMSVSIVWANKVASNRGFRWTGSMTAFHFLITAIGMEGLRRAGFFEKKDMPVRSVVPISLAFTGFVVFNNFSLKYNSVGVYQLMKVLTTPVIVAIQYFYYKSNDVKSLSQLLALGLICVGVGLATVASLDSTAIGLLFGTLGIFSTSIYQIWVKTKQAELQTNPQQLLHYQAPVSFVMLVCISPMIETVFVSEAAQTVDAETGVVSSHALLAFEWMVDPVCVTAVLLSGAFAFLVNLSIFLVIGRTNPVAYNVLGHGKLCVILAMGYLLFGEQMTPFNLAGVMMAVAGVVTYTHLKLSEKKQASM